MVFCLFQCFLPFFTLLGAYLPLEDPSTSIPAPFMLLLKEYKIRGDRLKAKNSFFFHKLHLFCCFSLFLWFFAIFQIFMTLLLSQPPLCTLWRNKKFMETNTRQEIISFTKNVACFASFLFLSGFCHFSQFLDPNYPQWSPQPPSYSLSWSPEGTSC